MCVKDFRQTSIKTIQVIIVQSKRTILNLTLTSGKEVAEIEIGMGFDQL